MSDFAEQTAYLTLPPGHHRKAFVRFTLEVLALVRGKWPPPAAHWYSVIEESLAREDGERMAKALHPDIRTYRTQVLKEPNFLNSHSQPTALTYLFEMSADPVLTPNAAATDTTLARAIDEFADEFIEHFGRWQEVLEILKKSFGVEA